MQKSTKGKGTRAGRRRAVSLGNQAQASKSPSLWSHTGWVQFLHVLTIIETTDKSEMLSTKEAPERLHVQGIYQGLVMETPSGQQYILRFWTSRRKRTQYTITVASVISINYIVFIQFKHSEQIPQYQCGKYTCFLLNLFLGISIFCQRLTHFHPYSFLIFWNNST